MESITLIAGSNELYRLWLLKNLLAEIAQKIGRFRMPYKRLSPAAHTGASCDPYLVLVTRECHLLASSVS